MAYPWTRGESPEAYRKPALSSLPRDWLGVEGEAVQRAPHCGPGRWSRLSPTQPCGTKECTVIRLARSQRPSAGLCLVCCHTGVHSSSIYAHRFVIASLQTHSSRVPELPTSPLTSDAPLIPFYTITCQTFAPYAHSCFKFKSLSPHSLQPESAP